MECERQKIFFKVCSECKIHCCQNARPPLTLIRMNIITDYLRSQKIQVDNPFNHLEYPFPREDEEGYCIFYDKFTKRCVVHPVKPETCVAGPITFDINKKTGKIEWYLKLEKICPLAGIMNRDKEALKEHLKVAKREILQLVRELPPKDLQAILRIEEPDTFKIDEDELSEDILRKL